MVCVQDIIVPGRRRFRFFHARKRRTRRRFQRHRPGSAAGTGRRNPRISRRRAVARAAEKRFAPVRRRSPHIHGFGDVILSAEKCFIPMGCRIRRFRRGRETLRPRLGRIRLPPAAFAPWRRVGGGRVNCFSARH